MAVNLTLIALEVLNLMVLRLKPIHIMTLSNRVKIIKIDKVSKPPS